MNGLRLWKKCLKIRKEGRDIETVLSIFPYIQQMPLTVVSVGQEDPWQRSIQSLFIPPVMDISLPHKATHFLSRQLANAVQHPFPLLVTAPTSLGELLLLHAVWFWQDTVWCAAPWPVCSHRQSLPFPCPTRHCREEGADPKALHP